MPFIIMLLWEQGVVGSNPATPTKKKTLIIKLQTWLSAFSFYSKTPKAIEETTKQAKTKQLINYYYYEKHFIYTFCYSDLN